MSAAAIPIRAGRKMALFMDAIKFHESVFALPFAYTGMILAAGGLPTLWQFIWISVAMVGARTVGMAANRIIDRYIDGRNPRNAARHLPSGRLSARDMIALTIVALAVFALAAAMLNPLALALSPIAAAYLVFYPYTKRFTWASNLLLGWALAIAPTAAWIGVTGSLAWQPVLLSLAVALWAGSFDIVYHTQDYDFQKREGLHSVATRFGIAGAFRIARVWTGWRWWRWRRWEFGWGCSGCTTSESRWRRAFWCISTGWCRRTICRGWGWRFSASTPMCPQRCWRRRSSP